MKTLQERIDTHIGITFLYGLGTAVVLMTTFGVAPVPLWLNAILISAWLVAIYSWVRAYRTLCEQVEVYDGPVLVDGDSHSGTASRVAVHEG